MRKPRSSRQRASARALHPHERGAEPELSTSGGTSDARFIKDHCPVVECGLVGATMHKANECAPVADIAALARIYRRFFREAARALAPGPVAGDR
ncbi:MAG: hypothetical protein KatS3mg119_0450 [Rhodothalassiaceae bacterium]|nr:MAG: hypothetical protein KatS3mg119_0450 [Rhodothalassiaceae bacterium]